MSKHDDIRTEQFTQSKLSINNNCVDAHNHMTQEQLNSLSVVFDNDIKSHIHITPEQLMYYHNDQLGSKELMQLMSAASECEDCATLLADSFDNDKLLCPSDSFMENTLEVLFPRLSLYNKRKILFFHSLKVGFGTVAAVFFVLTSNVWASQTSDALSDYQRCEYIKTTSAYLESKDENQSYDNPNIEMPSLSGLTNTIKQFFTNKEVYND